jgi:hypothetical protein
MTAKRTRAGLFGLLLATLPFLPFAMSSGYDGTAAATVDRETTGVAGAGSAIPILMSELHTGAKPAVAYLVGTHVGTSDEAWTMRRSDGTRLGVPNRPVAFAPMGRGLVAVFNGEARIVFQYDGSGHAVRHSDIAGLRLAASPDHSIVGWVTPLGTPRVVEGGGSRTLTLPRVSQPRQIAAIMGSKTCKEGATSNGCSIIVNTSKGAWVSTSHGLVDKTGLSRVAAASVDSLATGTRGTGCNGVFKGLGIALWHSCHEKLFGFSVDGRRVVATGDLALRFRAARSGKVPAAWSHDDQLKLGKPVWENSRHVLVVAHRGGRWSVLRFGLDGTVEYAVPPRRGGTVAPFLLPTR